MTQIKLFFCSIFYVSSCIHVVYAQTLNNGDVMFETVLNYTAFEIRGSKIIQGFGDRIDFSSVSDGMYIVVTNGVSCIVTVQNASAVGIRLNELPMEVNQSTPNQVCVFGEDHRPFDDIETFKMYIHQRIDHLTSDSAKACEITRIATEWYPNGLHASWITQSWLYSMDEIFQHFLQVDSMGMCGDQAVFLGNFMHYFLGLRSCAIGMGHAHNDSINYFSHVQLLLELPVDSSHIIWAIFDSQNGVVYRDTLGNIIDFRDIFLRDKKPIADEMRPRGRMHTVWTCHDKDYSSEFPFNTLIVTKNNFHPLDSIVVTGERSLSFGFRENTPINDEWKKVGMSYGFIMDMVSPKQLADMSPLFTNNIWETTNYTEYGIPENLAFANEVRNFTQLYGFKKEDYLSTFQNTRAKKE